MWKSHLIVISKGFVLHSPCGKCCGNLFPTVEITAAHKVFHISTGGFWAGPVEMWKTLNQMLSLKNLAKKNTVEKISPEVELTTCKDYP